MKTTLSLGIHSNLKRTKFGQQFFIVALRSCFDGANKTTPFVEQLVYASHNNAFNCKSNCHGPTIREKGSCCKNNVLPVPGVRVFFNFG